MPLELDGLFNVYAMATLALLLVAATSVAVYYTLEARRLRKALGVDHLSDAEASDYLVGKNLLNHLREHVWANVLKDVDRTAVRTVGHTRHAVLDDLERLLTEYAESLQNGRQVAMDIIAHLKRNRAQVLKGADWMAEFTVNNVRLAALEDVEKILARHVHGDIGKQPPLY